MLGRFCRTFSVIICKCSVTDFILLLRGNTQISSTVEKSPTSPGVTPTDGYKPKHGMTSERRYQVHSLSGFLHPGGRGPESCNPGIPGSRTILILTDNLSQENAQTQAAKDRHRQQRTDMEGHKQTHAATDTQADTYRHRQPQTNTGSYRRTHTATDRHRQLQTYTYCHG